MAIVWNQKTGKIGPALVKMSSSPAYTLAEIEQLAREWCDLTDNRHTRSDAMQQRLTVSIFIEHLKQREREGGDGKIQEETYHSGS